MTWTRPLKREPTILLKGIFIIQILASRALSQRTCPKYDVENSIYKCELEIFGPNFKVFCIAENTSGIQDTFIEEHPIFIFLIRPGITDSKEKPNFDFQNVFSVKHLLNQTTFSSTSNFYACSKNIIRFLNPDILMRSSLCITNFDCLTVASQAIEDAFVNSLQITGEKLVHLDTTISTFTNLTDVVIRNNLALLFSDQVFGKAPLIERLLLSENNISVLPTNIFKGLDKVQVLDLSYNRLSVISTEILLPLTALHVLNISHNNIEEIQKTTFLGVPKLKTLNLSFNSLKALPRDVFQSTPILNDLDISGNEIQELPNNVFSKLTYLQTINLYSCKLKSLKNNTFQFAKNLKYLDLSRNEITNLPEEIFHKQIKLQHLNISYNKLVWFGDETLKNNADLRYLLMQNNHLESLSREIFSSTKFLRVLDISGNKLKIFDEGFAENMDNVYLLNISNNKLHKIELGSYGPLNVMKMDFSRNVISEFKIDWRQLVYLDNIKLDYNRLHSLVLPPCIPNMKQAITLSFRNNNISNIRLPYKLDIDESPAVLSGCFFNGLPKNSVLLTNNPLNCNCELFEFYNYMSDKLHMKTGTLKFHSFPDSGTLKCSKPDALHGKNLDEVREDLFTCPVDVDCPKYCTCSVRGFDNGTVVNCSDTGLWSIPSLSPWNTTVLYFERNNLTHMNSFDYIKWENLTELYLDDNLLSDVNVPAFPRSLHLLSLAGNRLKDLSPSLKSFTSTHKNFVLKIGHNRWYCNCTSKSLKYWLIKYKDNIKDIENVTCDLTESGQNRTVQLHKIPDTFLCPVQVSQKRLIGIILGIVSSSILIIVMLSVTLFYYRNKQIVQAYLYGTSLFRCCFIDDELDANKEFDAFIAYSSQDREIVMELMDELETKEPFFKLCIHERDWIPGNFISENIVYSVQYSKRIIVVLSEDFVSSVWFAIEVRAALFQMLQDKINRLLVVVVGEFPPVEMMEDDVRQILLRKTYLEWGEKWFWEKLKYAMPHKSINQGRNENRSTSVRPELVLLVENQVSAVLSATIQRSAYDDQRPVITN